MGKLVEGDKKLNKKICSLDDKIIDLEKNLESNLQYQRMLSYPVYQQRLIMNYWKVYVIFV